MRRITLRLIPPLLLITQEQQFWSDSTESVDVQFGKSTLAQRLAAHHRGGGANQSRNIEMSRLSCAALGTLTLLSFSAHSSDIVPRDLSSSSVFYAECSTPQRSDICTAYVKGLYEGILGARLSIGVSAIQYARWKLNLERNVTKGVGLGWALLPMTGTPDPWFPFCIPSDWNLSYADLTDIVVKHLQDNPEQRARTTADALLSALRALYPCVSEEEFAKKPRKMPDMNQPAP